MATCAETAITTTGAPATGAIAVVSGAKTITSGNLSGDIKTTGGTVTTLANSGVTTGTYTNPTINVDSKGRVTAASNGSGRAGGGAWWFQPPSAASFTSTQGSVGSATDDLQVGAVLPMGAPVAGDETRAFLKSIPNPSGDWSVEMGFTTTGAIGDYAGFGLVMTYSGGTRSHMWRNGVGNNGLAATKLFLPSGFNSNGISVAKPAGFPEFIRVSKVGNDLLFYSSSGGKVWAVAGTEPVASWLAAAPDRIGPGGFYNRTSGAVTVSVQYWKQSW